jgi:hypothetical protein
VVTTKKGTTTAFSDQLSALAARAKEAEDRAAAAKQRARSDLENEVNAVHESTRAHGDALRKKAEATKDKASAGWESVQRSWNDHLAGIRKNFEDRKAAHDLASARKSADRADQDADWAIDYAYAAVEEAESAVLDAIYARRAADELVTT